MKKKWLTKQKIIWLGIALVSLLLAFILSVIRKGMIEEQDAQMMARRWNPEGGVAQISCFFSREAYVSENQLITFEHVLDNALKEASIQLESTNPGARLWSDAYSASGSISVSTERTSLYLKAIGVGGDFFQFHPQDLEYGNYFSGRDLNADYVVIDEETAWQLFGGIDVAGKFVTIGGQPHVISGVIKRPQGRMEKAAGLDESIIYVSMKTFQQYGSGGNIENYEIVMPNPIKDFAMQKVKENLGVAENEVVYVENTGRFGIAKSLEIILQFGYRSMNGKAILYPYWENLARGCEDKLSVLTLFMLFFLALPAVILFVIIIHTWTHKGWTFGMAVRKGADFIYTLQSKSAMRKEKKKRMRDGKPIRVFYEEEKDEKGRKEEGRKDENE